MYVYSKSFGSEIVNGFYNYSSPEKFHNQRIRKSIAGGTLNPKDNATFAKSKVFISNIVFK